MTCPKCGYDNLPAREDCLRCGVIFAKVRERAALLEARSQEAPSPGDREADSPQGNTLADLLLSSPEKGGSLRLWGRAAALLVLVVWGGKLVFSGIEGNAAGASWIHLVNLPFHEAGHVFFRPLGSFMTSLGGTLGQLLVPLVCLSVLLIKTRDPFGAAVCLWWFGENFLDIAPYINDARAGRLPLIGGNFGDSSPYGFHDWEYLLTETGLLRYDHLLARISHGLGSVLMGLAVGWGAYLLYRQYQRRN